MSYITSLLFKLFSDGKQFTMWNLLGLHPYLMYKPLQSVFQYGDTNWIIVTVAEHMFPNLHIISMVFPLNDSNPSEKPWSTDESRLTCSTWRDQVL